MPCEYFMEENMIRYYHCLRKGFLVLIMLLNICMLNIGCGTVTDNEPLIEEDNSLLFEDGQEISYQEGIYTGMTLKEFFEQTGENYISVSGDTVRTKTYKIQINRISGDDMNECEIVSVEEIKRYNKYEGITYKEYVHLTDDREVVRITYLKNKEKSAYVETGNGILLYFSENVPNGIKPDKGTEKLFNLFITECTN